MAVETTWSDSDTKLVSSKGMATKASALITASIASSISDGDLTHSVDGNSVFDALALKAPINSPVFTGTGSIPTLYINNLIMPFISILTIASGVITVTGTYHSVDTEGGAASDDLDTIDGATATGQIIILRSTLSTRDIVVKNGTGNIQCGADRTLNTKEDRIMLMWSGIAWIMLSYADN
jgi:hypothetical protein